MSFAASVGLSRPDYALPVMAQGSDESGEQRRLRAALGRGLAGAEGFRVVGSGGERVGWLDHVRYERHADYPDVLVVRRRGLLSGRRRLIPFGAVEAVRPEERTVIVRVEGQARERSRSS